MYCPGGSPAPLPCAAGYYTDYEGAEACDTCPEGYFCVPDLIVPGECKIFCGVTSPWTVCNLLFKKLW